MGNPGESEENCQNSITFCLLHARVRISTAKCAALPRANKGGSAHPFGRLLKVGGRLAWAKYRLSDLDDTGDIENPSGTQAK